MEFNKITVAGSSNVNISREFVNIRNVDILEEGPQMSQDLNMKNQPIVEEGPQVSQDFNVRNLRILEEGPQICPLCSQEIRMYFINYTEKIEMCENLECDYPFGYESFKILREENGVQSVEIKSLTARETRSTACSQASSQGWSDVDKVCKVFDTDECSNMEGGIGRLKTAPPPLKKTDSQRRKEELLANVEKIKQMTKNMSGVKKEPKGIIKNEKWIKNLQYLQGLSGVNLLKPAELKKIKKKTCPPGPGALRIDIDNNNLASIKIEMNLPMSSSTTQA